MRILVNARHSSPRVAHGGPVMARRHAQALARKGLDVVLVAPEPPEGEEEMLRVRGYRPSATSSPYLASLRPNEGAITALQSIIREVAADLVYDASGPAWGISAAVASGIPVVSMVCDYNWFCARSFLVDSDLRRCVGPDSVMKCFRCETRYHPAKRRAVQSLLKNMAIVGIPPHWPAIQRLAPYRVWSELSESNAYLEDLRSRVDCYVIGDRQAHSFFTSHGIPQDRIEHVPQCLPAEALADRRHEKLPPPKAGERPIVFGFVGRLDVEKGLHVLANAFEELPKNVAAELWVIHVTDATREKLEPMFRDKPRLRRALDNGAIKLFRPERKDDLYSLMARVDVGVVPSIAYESPSLAMMEFAAQGTPVIRSESAGMDHVIQDGINGRTFPYGDASALCAVLRETIADPGQIARWQSRLPTISDDSVYAQGLIDVFSRLVPH